MKLTDFIQNNEFSLDSLIKFVELALMFLPKRKAEKLRPFILQLKGLMEKKVGDIDFADVQVFMGAYDAIKKLKIFDDDTNAPDDAKEPETTGATETPTPSTPDTTMLPTRNSTIEKFNAGTFARPHLVPTPDQIMEAPINIVVNPIGGLQYTIQGECNPASNHRILTLNFNSETGELITWKDWSVHQSNTLDSRWFKNNEFLPAEIDCRNVPNAIGITLWVEYVGEGHGIAKVHGRSKLYGYDKIQ